MSERSTELRSKRAPGRWRTWLALIIIFLVISAVTFCVAANRYRMARMDYVLFVYAGQGDLVSVRSLLDRGANANARIYANNFPPSNFKGWIDLFLNRTKVNKDYSSPLVAAFDGSHAKVAKLLLERGASNVNDIAGWGNKRQTLLMTAAQMGDTELIQMLLDRGANLEARDWIRTTPLGYAMISTKWKAVKLLLDRGANADCRDQVGRTVFEYCHNSTPTEIIEDLLDHGAKIDAYDQNVWTPLMMASRWGNLVTVKLLVKRGANVNLRNRYGSTALSYAKARKREDIVNMLLAAGAKS